VTATRHVDETVSIISTIRDSLTRKALWGHNGISKGGTIVHRNVACRPVRERKNNMPNVEDVISGAVRSALEIGNGVLRATLSRKTRMVCVALMLAPGSHCA
jgi:hypothetical protein